MKDGEYEFEIIKRLSLERSYIIKQPLRQSFLHKLGSLLGRK